jgi:sulfur-carrier protein
VRHGPERGVGWTSWVALAGWGEVAVITVRYFAGARAAAGVPEERTEAGTIADLLSALAARGEPLSAVLRSASFLVDGVACHDRSAPLPPGATVDILPPFAGG